jgi:excisionase family DNA binding protein
VSVHHPPPLPAVLSETRLTPSQAAALLGTTVRTVVRWLSRGLPVRGAAVRLEGVMTGTRWQTSREAVGRFLAACDAARNPPPPLATTPAKKRREQGAVMKRLAAKGATW